MIANDSTQNDSPSVLVPSAEEQASLGMLLIKTPEQGMTASLIEWSVVKTVLCFSIVPLHFFTDGFGTVGFLKCRVSVEFSLVGVLVFTGILPRILLQATGVRIANNKHLQYRCDVRFSAWARLGIGW